MSHKEVGRTSWPYFREFGGAMVLYTITIAVSSMLRGDISHRGLAIAIELSPIIPVFLAFWAIIRQIKRMDELQRRIQSEAFALAGILLSLAMMVYGFAENVGAPQLPVIWVTPILIGLWGICMPIISRRYQ